MSWRSKIRNVLLYLIELCAAGHNLALNETAGGDWLNPAQLSRARFGWADGYSNCAFDGRSERENPVLSQVTTPVLRAYMKSDHC
jgi:hypothetical protein